MSMKQTVEDMVTTVTDILQHDNLDSRVYIWLQLALNDVTEKIAGWAGMSVSLAFAFQSLSTVIRDTTWQDQYIVRDPVFAMFVSRVGGESTDNGVLQTPHYLPIQDMMRMRRMTESGTHIKYWSIGPGERARSRLGEASFSDPMSKSTIWHWPAPAIEATVQIFYQGQTNTEKLTAADRIPVPNVYGPALIWQAAAYGAQIVNPAIHPLCQSEAEYWTTLLSQLMNVTPDVRPARRSMYGEMSDWTHSRPFPRMPEAFPPQDR